MKWKSVTLCAVAILGITASNYAQQPTLSARRTAQPAGSMTVPAAPQARKPIFSQISWWAKFGQPVEGAVEAAPAGEPPVIHDHGYGFGYVYGPGSCDCRPPCTDQLWAGYEQMPWRCSHPQYKEKYRGYCGSCGNGGCGHVSDCGCTTAVPSCAAAPSCTDSCTSSVCCKPKCKKCKQWFAHWHWGKKGCDTCDSCSAPMSCGCAAPVSCGCAMPVGGAPPAVGAPAVGPPVPAADEASILKKPLWQRVSASRSTVR
jgi:hypothetical protein